MNPGVSTRNGIYFDQPWGLLVTNVGDGGDTLHRESFARLVNHLMGRDLFGLTSDAHFIASCRVDKGLWRRHPDTTKWYSNPKTTTRDQYATLICWLALAGKRDLLDEIRLLLASRGGLFPNTEKGWGEGEKQYWKGEFPDPITPDLLSILHHRTEAVEYADAAMIYNSMAKAGKLPGFDLGTGVFVGDNKQTDDTGHIAVLVTSRLLKRTVGSDVAYRLYVEGALCPPDVSDETKIMVDQNRAMARLRYWFREAMGANPGFAEAMRPFILKHFGGGGGCPPSS
jgi:hypothetical protein